jgi:hypothetical protein
MSIESERMQSSEPSIAAAVAELQGMIRARYPGAAFRVVQGDDPDGVYVIVTVDVPDTDDVFEVVVARLLEMQVEVGLRVYVIPVRPVARIMAELREHGTPPLPTLLPLG